MFELLVSVIATTIEGICIFVLTLNLFRFKARDHIVAIGIANLLVSVTNYLMKTYNFYYDYTPLVNIAILILVLIFLFRISLLGSIIMSALGFIACTVIQSIVVAIFLLVTKVTLKEMRIEDAAYFLQVSSGLLILLVSYFLTKKHLWFTFIPFSWTFKIKLTKVNVTVLTVFSVILCIVGLFVHYNNIYLIIILSVVILATIMMIAIRKERAYD